MSCKKNIKNAIALSLMAAPVVAAPYDGMWKEFNTALTNDRPRTAIEVLQRIEQKAVEQKSYGHLLKAMFEEKGVLGMLSPDSALAAQKRLEARREEWKKTNGVVAAVCQTVMDGTQNAPRLDSLLASPDAAAYTLKNGAAAYEPLAVKGVDSRYFENNLLAAIASETGQWRELHEYYVGKGDRKAACIAAAMWLEREGTLQLADSLVNIYSDLLECGAIAVRKLDCISYDDLKARYDWIAEALRRWPEWKENNRLKNALGEMTQAMVQCRMDRDMVTTDTDVLLHLTNLRNVKGVKVVLRRKNKKAKGGYDMERRYEKAVALPNDYVTAGDSLQLGRLPLGQWQCLVSDTDGKLKQEKMQFAVTDLRIIHIDLPKNRKRLVVVNAVTGEAVPGAVLHIKDDSRKNSWRKVQTDEKGEYVWNDAKSYFDIYATKGEDTAMEWQSMYGQYHSNGTRTMRQQCNIYTDRAIYRPGQTVKVALAAYTLDGGIRVKALEGDTIEVTLRNAHNKVVERKSVTTNGFGAAAVEFTLPTEEQNGTWTVMTRYGRERIRVENYHRPTFEVTLQQPETEYKAGDTLTVKGTARTYSGVPVPDAKVAYRVRRNKKWWCLMPSDGSMELMSDTVTTAADGTFEIRMPMLLPENGGGMMPRFYDVTAVADVTNSAGESHAAEISLPVASRKAYLSCQMADKLLADSAITVTVMRRNMAGTPIEGRVEMLLDGKRQADAEANKPYALAANMPSGEHTLTAICEGDTVKNTFVAFRKSDARPMKYTHQWVYQSAAEFPEHGDSVWIQVGTSDSDVSAYYTVVANDSVIAQGVTRLSNENITRTMAYKPEYGDGVSISLAWVKNGELYSDEMTIRRPVPANRLKMEWVTFRDRLVPGQKEQWTARVTTLEGTPAEARVMAVAYDHALDQLEMHSWTMSDMRYVWVPKVRWNINLSHPVWQGLYADMPTLRARNLNFTSFGNYAIGDGKVFNCIESVPLARIQGSGRMMMKSSAAVGAMTVIEEVARGEVLSARAFDTEDAIESAEQDNDGAQEDAHIAMRSDFAETAFFMPAMFTDAKGDVTMTFTLPESVTTWRVMALAHDKNMRFATLQSDAIAQKQLMVQPNMPRFLRSGDNATVQATVTNLTDKAAEVKAVMTILDAKTEKVIARETQKVKVGSEESAAVTFPVDARKLADGDYICRITAQGAGHTDGEQHYLNVLSNEETVTKTVAYTFTEPTDTLLQFSDMMPGTVQKAHLKVDYVDNPAWLMIETLPQMVKACPKNAVSLSNALYASRVAAKLKWEENKSDSVLTQLKKLQNSDGSFSWWDGMQGSSYMTLAVVKTLVRLNWLCGRQADTQQLLDKAFRFMQKEMDAEVARMKKRDGAHLIYIGGYHLDWLYSLALDGRKGGASADWLLGEMKKEKRFSDMATAAVAAIVFEKNGEKKAARSVAETLKQYTVYRSDIGRYYDSPRAMMDWCDYRIPTQTMAIEALRMVTPQDRKTISEMQRWLLSCKRTQQWDNPCNTVNAVHAFFSDGVSVLTREKGQQTLADKEVNRKNATVRVKKQSDGESWAAAYVSFRQPSADVEAAATGLAVKRELLMNGRPVSEGDVKVGDRIQVRLTVTADRDYDFVTVTDRRAACLEPAAVQSGYRGGCYQEIKDNETLFHFDRMSKGTHEIVTDYYVDRTGTYHSGTATVQCAYANEFRGTAAAYDVSIRK